MGRVASVTAVEDQEDQEGRECLLPTVRDTDGGGRNVRACVGRRMYIRLLTTVVTMPGEESGQRWGAVHHAGRNMSSLGTAEASFATGL